MSTTEDRLAMIHAHLAALWPPDWRATFTTRSTQPFLVTSHPDPAQAKPHGKPPWLSSWSRVPSDLDTAARRTLDLSATHDLYYSVNLGAPACRASQRTRLKQCDIYVVPGLLGDFDGAWGNHKGEGHRLPETREALLAFLHRLPSPPTLIIDSGGGFHSYHLFAQLWTLATPEDRSAFVELATRFQTTVERLAQEQHAWVSNGIFTADLTRVLRLAGTTNHKYHTVVTVLEHNERRYSPAEIGDWLDAPVARTPRTTPPRTTPPGASSTETGTLDIVSLATHYGMELARKGEDELCGASPTHGSDTGTNIGIHPADNVWHCFRHGSGGGPLLFLAVCEGLLDCAKAKPKGLRGAPYVTAVEIANAQWQAGIDLDERQARLDAQDAADNALAADLAGPPARQHAPPAQETDPPPAPSISHHVVPGYLLKHPDPRVRAHWKRLYRQTAILKERYAREGGLLCQK